MECTSPQTKEKKIPKENQFLSVTYPGNVVNIDVALLTLGGLDSVVNVLILLSFFIS
jgi:hypothetical protein